MSVAVSHDGAWVVSGSKDRSVQFWDSRSAIAQCVIQGHKNSGEFVVSFLPPFLKGIVNVFLVISVDLSPAGGIMATGSGDWQARICMSPILQSLSFGK